MPVEVWTRLVDHYYPDESRRVVRCAQLNRDERANEVTRAHMVKYRNMFSTKTAIQQIKG